MAKLPNKVAQQVEEADRLAKELFNPEPAPNPGTPPEPAPEVTPPAPEPPQEPVVEPPQEPQEPLEPPQEPITPVLVEDWEHKYKVLQGKYNKEISEVPALVRENNFLRARLETLEKVVLMGKPSEPGPSVSIEPEDPAEAEFKKEFPDLYRLMEVMVQRRVGSVEKQVGDVVKKSAETAQETFFSMLNSRVPDWQAVNLAPEFLEWLQQKESPYSPYTLHQRLIEAGNQLDGETVTKIMCAYKEAQKSVTPSTPTPPATPNPQGLAQYVAPKPSPRPTVTTPPAGEPKKVYTKEEINQFYRDLALGKLLLTTEQKLLAEQEIWAAVAENRVK